MLKGCNHELCQEIFRESGEGGYEDLVSIGNTSHFPIFALFKRLLVSHPWGKKKVCFFTKALFWETKIQLNGIMVQAWAQLAEAKDMNCRVKPCKVWLEKVP